MHATNAYMRARMPYIYIYIYKHGIHIQHRYSVAVRRLALALVLGTLSSKIIAMSGAASNACNLANSTKWPSDAIAAGSWSFRLFICS